MTTNVLVWHPITTSGATTGKRTFAPPSEQKLVGIGTLKLTSLPPVFSFFQSDQEELVVKELLAEFASVEAKGSVIVSCFGREFGYPVLVSAALRNCTSLEPYLDKFTDYTKCFDISSWLNWQLHEKTSFDLVTKLMGLPPRPTKDVLALIAAKKWKTLRSRLAIDCLILAFSWLHIQVVTGKLSLARIAKEIKKLTEYYDNLPGELTKTYLFDLKSPR